MADPQLLRVIAEALQLAPDQIGPDASSDIVEAWDSLGHLEVVLAVEHAFNVKFNTSEIAELVSVARLEEALCRRDAQ